MQHPSFWGYLWAVSYSLIFEWFVVGVAVASTCRYDMFVILSHNTQLLSLMGFKWLLSGNHLRWYCLFNSLFPGFFLTFFHTFLPTYLPSYLTTHVPPLIPHHPGSLFTTTLQCIYPVPFYKNSDAIFSYCSTYVPLRNCTAQSLGEQASASESFTPQCWARGNYYIWNHLFKTVADWQSLFLYHFLKMER